MDAKRDWGYAKEYVEGMWRMLQVDEPDTYVLATNRTETVRDFVSMAFKAVGVAVNFKGEAENEVGIDVGGRQDGDARESEVLSPGRGGTADRQSGKGEAEAGLGTEDYAGRVVRDDGSSGSAAQ